MAKTEFVNETEEQNSMEVATQGAVITDPKEQFRLITASTVGYCVELFDFTVYSFFAGYIGKVFFASDNALVSLLLSLSVFAVGFVARPLGALILGMYADKHGRRSCMTLSISLMGLGCLLIACAPTPAMVGPVMAPAFIVIGRLIQGFSAGAELSASISLLLESAPKNKRGFFLCWPDAIQGVTSFIGAGLAGILIGTLSDEQMHVFGWRIPFFLALVIIPIGVYIRRHLHETLDEKKVDQKRNLIVTLFTTYRKPALLLVGVACHGTIISYTYTYFIVHYAATRDLGFDGNFLSMCSSITYFIAALLSGPIADRMHSYKNYVTFMLCLLIVSSGFTFFFTDHPWIFFFAYISGNFILGIYGAASSLLLLPAFPQFIRTTAFGTMSALNLAIFGGTSQMVVSYLLLISDNRPEIPFYYIAIALVVSIISTRYFPEKIDKEKGEGQSGQEAVKSAA